MELRGDDIHFADQEPHSRPGRVLLYLVLALLGIALDWGLLSGRVPRPDLFAPTPTPTRSAVSWAEEGNAQFIAGNLDAAIQAYKMATRLDPRNGQLWAELARVQVYSSALLPTDEQKFVRRQEALASANKAVEVAPDDPRAHAVRAFALDWLATSNLASVEESDRWLAEAESEAARALVLAKNDPLALAYDAEVLLDQQKWLQANRFAELAVQYGPDLLDTHRVYAAVLETLGQYNKAIQEYKKAIQLAPNLTFFYLRAGLIYRHLGGSAEASEAYRKALYQKALDFFDQAAKINQRLGINDPTPYIAIAKTYAQMGQFFIAARNAERALLMDPTNPNTYAELGIIYIKARNYEGAVPVLKCAVEGCTAEETGAIIKDLQKRFVGFDHLKGTAVQPLPLTDRTVGFYYVSYGSVLAALDRCNEALPVLDKVERTYPNDPVLSSIVRENRQICRTLANEKQAATPTPTPSPSPTPQP